MWARNSLVLGYVEPPYSDIDITLVAGTDKPLILQQGVQLISRIKKVLLPLGEVNVYLEKDIPTLSQLANPFEIQRDPKLSNWIQRKQVPTQADKIAFLVKQIELNYKVLHQKPWTRQRKFKFHFKDLLGEEVQDGQMSPAALLNSLSRHVSDSKFFLLSLERYLNLQSQGVPTSQMPQEVLSDPWCWAFFPNHLCFLDSVPALSDFQKDSLLSNVGWEVWGLSTQLNWNDPATQSHRGRLNRLIKRVSEQGPVTSAQEAKIQALLQFLK